MGDEDFLNDLQTFIHTGDIENLEQYIRSVAVDMPTISVTLNGDEVGTVSLGDIRDSISSNVLQIEKGDIGVCSNPHYGFNMGKREAIIGDREERFDQIIEIINGMMLNGFTPISIQEIPRTWYHSMESPECREIVLKFEK